MKQGILRWSLIVGAGSLLMTLLGAGWFTEPAAACGVRCGGPHPTAKPKVKPASRPFQKPPQATVVVPKVPPKPAPIVVPRPAPPRLVAPAPTATRAPAPPAVSRAVPAAVGVGQPPAPRATSTAPPPPVPTSTVTPEPGATTAPGLALITTSLPSTSASEQVNYVVQYYSLNDSRDAPKDMGDVLLANGFHLAKRPESGGVVIFQPGYFKNTNGYDAMKDAGMIGVVSDIDTETPTTYRVIVHTAFDAPPVEAVATAPEDNFASVYDLPMGPYGKGQVAVLYFVR